MFRSSSTTRIFSGIGIEYRAGWSETGLNALRVEELPARRPGLAAAAVQVVAARPLDVEAAARHDARAHPRAAQREPPHRACREVDRVVGLADRDGLVALILEALVAAGERPVLTAVVGLVLHLDGAARDAPPLCAVAVDVEGSLPCGVERSAVRPARVRKKRRRPQRDLWRARQRARTSPNCESTDALIVGAAPIPSRTRL